uniref:NADH-ubiquinone oxidoreductase chain 2 n=2 Tax=Parasesarma TaxID=285658 RepID=A0A3G4R2Y2_9EUCA|nr:NADH dehydrogenase subunit 2 [Parasesarma affine]YP_009967223.1 NADH dehydrogenase subunit 2 [Parasesarma bidens]ATV99240.1 NADH dehydrogenase subunit 2 [Parasesarma bidens]AYU57077.1 NADH dehydrogenase subunit 2 [Parasesarma affine]WRK84363.1 NADH dehydrogenase subunit 2 [Parasesarma affine]
MFFPLSYIIFVFTLILGSIISISSSSWFGAWVGLELNMMSFIPLITLKMNSYYSEAALKYFLIQALGSALFISSGFLSLLFFYISYILIFLALLLKLASAPFHFWFPQVMEGLNWPQIFLLSSIQKLAPMILLSYLLINSILIKMVIFFSILSAIVGALGGLNLLQLRKIIAFSSINHMSWMMIAISTGDVFWLIYFIIYTFILLSITSMFYNLQMFTLSNLIQSDQNSVLHSILISFNLLSLGGLPPFTGFIPKWMLIQMMVNMNMYIPLFFLLFSALITLYFYLRIIIMFIVLLNPIMNFNMKYKSLTSNTPMMMKTFFNFIGLLLPIYFLLI